MMADTVALAADHAGLELKDLLRDEIRRRGLQVLDLGTHDRSSVDYPTRVALDDTYVRSWSILLDLRILFSTILVVLKSGDAA